ncbi:hypothetical protein [Sinorhizobium meliloti]|uniref:hypothetical protein n=1 Tax=Rhizobium meliloti TaxID=382 RepID=UPI000FDC3899|nr:hypothetical protein [Sinorhizobium meliloti]RVE91070.1 hypothetical protein CN238_08350 [Sinorhizobium meliloti]RVH34159.1 hypothetical protein CN214_07460 [Sinorhizobium meliloti]
MGDPLNSNEPSKSRQRRYVTFRSYAPVSDPIDLNVDDSRAIACVAQIQQDLGCELPLVGKRFVVILESLFVAEEQKAYARVLRSLGGLVDFASKLWGNKEMRITSHVEGNWNQLNAAHTIALTKDIAKDVIPQLARYSAIIFSANYTMKRLSWLAEISTAKDSEELREARQNSDLGLLVDAAMRNERLVKAFNCHAIWALMTQPEHAQGITMAFNGVMAPEADALRIEVAPNPDGQDIHLHTHVDGKVVSSAAGVNGGTEALLRSLVRTILASER